MTTQTTTTTPSTPHTVSMPSFHPKDGVRCLYLRGRRGRPVGLVMSVRKDGKTMFGWSMCAKGDTFRKTDARRFAFERLTELPTDATAPAEGLSDTPMNRVLTHLAGLPTGVPAVIQQGVRRAIAARQAEETERSAESSRMVVSRTPVQPKLSLLERAMLKLRMMFMDR